jgi:hypothetical protein
MHLSMSGEDNEKGYAFLTSSKDETTEYEHNQKCKQTKRVSNDHVPWKGPNHPEKCNSHLM